MLVPGLKVDLSDSQDTVCINRENVVEVVRSSRSGRNVVEAERAQNVVVLGQRSLALKNVYEVILIFIIIQYLQRYQ